ncbi:MAG TPA: universal stress protein [Saprospiraceae bacterium]|nr:universal stress protein [Saprospiraceae bacterium]HMQ82197.1 universal stress protein [Saprospiraceae bacterium]
MKKILVPTDFSAVANNAYKFAQQLAQSGEAEITVAHAFHPSYDFANPYVDVPVVAFEEMKREQLDNFVADQAREFAETDVAVKVQPKSMLVVGFATEEIVRLSKEYDLIVMGTTGSSNLLDKVFGSVSSHVARHAHCPVMLIPANCECHLFREVVFATNYQAADEILLQPILQMLDDERLNIHFAHIEKNRDVDYKVKQMAYEQAISKGKPGTGFFYSEITSESVHHGIVQYAENVGADLIIMSTGHRSFIENLFHKSITKEVVFHTSVPLMVLHYGE